MRRNDIGQRDIAESENVRGKRTYAGRVAAAGWDKLNFAWAGATQVGQGHYYRVQNNTFLIEFDNTQNNAHHPHAVLRDFANDFGTDYLQQHLRAEHGK